MNPSTASAGLGLLSAASWGGSDFAGGLGARRAPALLVTASGQFISLVLLAGVCVAAGIVMPARRDLILAAAGGFEGALALAVFYRALAMGAMGLTAALTGLLTALVPVAFSMAHFGMPTAGTATGLAAGCGAIWLITHQPASGAVPARALLLGATAGIGFGMQLILFRLSEGSSLLGILTVARAAGVLALLLVLVWVRPRGAGSSYWLAGTVAGIFDTIGNLFYLRAAQLGRLDAAAVICSLYPAGTIVLAGVVLHERPSRRQLAGMALALAAVGLLSLSGSQ